MCIISLFNLMNESPHHLKSCFKKIIKIETSQFGFFFKKSLNEKSMLLGSAGVINYTINQMTNREEKSNFLFIHILFCRVHYNVRNGSHGAVVSRLLRFVVHDKKNFFLLAQKFPKTSLTLFVYTALYFHI